MKRSVRIFWRIFLGFVGFVILIFVLAAIGVFGKMPSMKELENPSLLQTSEVYAVDGTLMGKYYRENGNRSNVNYSDISPNVINALVATEDIRFYKHSGIDIRGTMRAVLFLGRGGGGSTITQQLAKALLGQGQKGGMLKRMIEKVKEYIIAVKLERNFTKEEILALYLNAVPFPDNVYGIRNASRTFFQKEPDRLSVHESAMLIGMLKGNIYNPRRFYLPAFNRRNVVIDQMVKNNFLTTADGAKYKAMPIDLSHYRKMDENTGYAPYFREVLKDEVRQILKNYKKQNGDPYNIYDDGLKIYTTINVKMQEYAEEAVAQWMPSLQKALNAQSFLKKVWNEHKDYIEKYMKESDRWKNLEEDGLSEKEIRATFTQKTPMKVFAWNSNRQKDTVMTPLDSIKYHRQMMQCAFMVTDPVTGEVRAWVGGIGFKSYKLDHANLKTKRQVGSTIKPLLYTQAIAEAGLKPWDSIPNEPQFFPKNGWVPAGKKCLGPPTVTVAGALAHSLNCASAYIMKQVTPTRFADFLQRLEIPTKVDVVPSLALGACNLSLYEMMWAYSIFGGRGFSTKPYFISRIEDRNGNVIVRFDNGVNHASKEVIDEVTAYNMVQVMQGTVDRGTAIGLRGRLGAAEMGGKTGTTNDNTDAWFMGYVPQLQAGVWIGCDDQFIRLENNLGYGGRAALPVWEYFFKKVYADKSLGIDRNAKFTVPANLNEVNPADIWESIDSTAPQGQGEDQGVGNSQDFNFSPNYIPPESQPVKDDEEKKKKDTSMQKTKDPKMWEMNPADTAKKKKGFLKRLFSKKDSTEE
jgi:penicillin-binding protein 1A